MTHTFMHEYWFVPGVIDRDKVHSEASQKSIGNPGEGYVVHTHAKGKCKKTDECVTYIGGKVHHGKVRPSQLQQ